MKTGRILKEGDGGPLFLLGVFEGEDDYVVSIFENVREMCPGKAFTLVSYETDDWDRDFSPWEADGAMEGERFAGGGEAVLTWLSEALIADLRGINASNRVFICGYSLSGLFALWSLYRSDLFDGCACCSGSLWFDGWKDFAASRTIVKKGLIYLSLGGKEEKSKNAVMATIGDATRFQDKLLDKDENAVRHTLVMNPGGHFASTDKRVARGIAWLLEENAKM